MSGSQYVACPICGATVANWLINSHLDSCINSENGEHGGGGDATFAPPSPSISASITSPLKRKKTGLGHANDQEDIFSMFNEKALAESGENGEIEEKGDKDKGQEKGEKKRKIAMMYDSRPLSDKIRPEKLDEFFGQKDILGEKAILRDLLQKDKLPSLILWGPPGSGKTTLAKIVSQATNSHFVGFSAVNNNVSDLKKISAEAASRKALSGQKTILFIDEIHRFNKAQQDSLLPMVEKGIVTLIGATTENPSFTVNNSLCSRCRVFVFHRLTEEDLEQILQRAINLYNENYENKIEIDQTASKILIELSDGDARILINSLESAINYATKDNQPNCAITSELIQEAFNKKTTLYDRDGEEHYNIISALHKSMRGSDVNAALYWLGRMIESGENPLYVARRLIRFASEDIGIADSQALVVAVSTYQACHFNGMPECDVNLAHCVAYLAQAPKNVSVYHAYNKVKETIKSHPTYPVPLHIRNAPTKLMKDLGYSLGYKYNPDYEGTVNQTYLPKELQHIDFFESKEKQKDSN